jgi:hypothetical protein
MVAYICDLSYMRGLPSEAGLDKNMIVPEK